MNENRSSLAFLEIFGSTTTTTEILFNISPPIAHDIQKSVFLFIYLIPGIHLTLFQDQPTSKKYAIGLGILTVIIFIVFLVSFFMYIHAFFIHKQSAPRKDVNYSVTRRSNGSLIRPANEPDTSRSNFIPRGRSGKDKDKKKGPGHAYLGRGKLIIEMPRLPRRRSGRLNRTLKTQPKKRPKRPRPPEYGYYGREGMRGRYYPLPAKRYRNVTRFKRGMRCPDGAPPRYNIDEGSKLPQVKFRKFRLQLFLQKEVNRRWRHRCEHNFCYIDWERHDIICRGNHFRTAITLFLAAVATSFIL